jgi:hypothetical protein
LSLQRTVQDLRDDILAIEKDFQALVIENERLKGKAKLMTFGITKLRSLKPSKWSMFS